MSWIKKKKSHKVSEYINVPVINDSILKMKNVVEIEIKFYIFTCMLVCGKYVDLHPNQNHQLIPEVRVLVH